MLTPGVAMCSMRCRCALCILIPCCSAVKAHGDLQTKRERALMDLDFLAGLFRYLDSRHMDRAIFSTEIKPIGNQLSFYDGL